jgi:hypothetical protein
MTNAAEALDAALKLSRENRALKKELAEARSTIERLQRVVGEEGGESVVYSWAHWCEINDALQKAAALGADGVVSFSIVTKEYLQEVFESCMAALYGKDWQQSMSRGEF